MGVYEELQARGLLAQVTNEEEIRKVVNNGKATFYIGFDCTADSLTVGHFMALTLMKRLQMAGNKPIALIGGGTTMIGDPSGRTDMRKMLTKEDIDHNAACFKAPDGALYRVWRRLTRHMMLNNADWLLNLNYVELLREVGACFSVNNMLRAECYKQRMEKGLSFLEFNYMIMQSYDFYYMFQHYGCNMQFGGDDQWSNMLGGTELIRRKLGKDAHAMTITLAHRFPGQEDGQDRRQRRLAGPQQDHLPLISTSTGATWATPTCSSASACSPSCPWSRSTRWTAWEGSQLNKAKEILAYELTKMVHGEEEAKKAQEGAHALFGAGADTANMPTTQLAEEDFTDGQIAVLDLLVKTGLASSKGEGRRLIQQGGLTVGEEKVTDITKTFPKADFEAGLVIKKGKKVFHKAIV